MKDTADGIVASNQARKRIEKNVGRYTISDV